MSFQKVNHTLSNTVLCRLYHTDIRNISRADVVWHKRWLSKHRNDGTRSQVWSPRSRYLFIPIPGSRSLTWFWEGSERIENDRSWFWSLWKETCKERVMWSLTTEDKGHKCALNSTSNASPRGEGPGRAHLHPCFRSHQWLSALWRVRESCRAANDCLYYVSLPLVDKFYRLIKGYSLVSAD